MSGFTPEMRAKAAATRAAKKAAKAAAAAPPPEAKPAEFAGLTKNACCDACGEKGCVISGQPYCAHPRKGGLHHNQMQDSKALGRFQRARDALA